MSKLTDAILVVSEYFTENKLIVICFAILLYEFLIRRKASGFLKVVFASVLLVMFPLTGMVLRIYQPAVYEQGFVWALVPVLAVAAYAGVTFLWDMVSEAEMSGKVIGSCLAVCGVLFLLGNQGRVQRVTLDEADARSAYGQVAESLPEETILWGLRELMGWVRSHNAEVKLVYGMDMWDAQAAAYDGDAYTPELAAAYEWMQELHEFTYQLEITTDVVLPIPDSIVDGLQSSFDAVEDAGANVVVLPTITYQRIAELIPAEYESREVAEYTLLQRGR